MMPWETAPVQPLSRNDGIMQHVEETCEGIPEFLKNDDGIPAFLKRDANNIAPWMRKLPPIKPKERPKSEFPWASPSNSPQA